MEGSGGWLARVARRFGAMLGGQEDVVADQPGAARAAAPNMPLPGVEQQPLTAVAGHPSVHVDASGRYVSGGYSFSTLDQAINYEDRRHTPQAPAPAMQAAAPVTHGRATPRWIPTPETISAGGQSVVADMVYHGTPLRYDPRHDQSRIDPTLRVDPRGDPYGSTLDYWPSYQGLDPRARATYIAWLEGGRTDREIPIGYVFVFFYGLEQRLLLDDSRDEAWAIFAETRRLLAIHGNNHSFRTYAAKLLALSALYEDQDDGPPTAAAAENYDLEIPLDVRVRLGRRLRDGNAFNADDALRWVLSLPDVYLRTPGQRCFEELRALWSVRFAARHPDGLTIRRPKATIKHEYRAASGKFTTSLNVGELPDVSGTTAVLGPLRALLDLCIDDLSQLSRLLGREPEARGMLRADLLLPPELRETSARLTSCREKLAMIVSGTGRGVLTAAELARTLDFEPEPGSDKLSAAMVRQIVTALDALHHGCEPDRRYGPGSALRADAPVALFATNGGGSVDHERPAYAAARTMVEISILAAASDGEVVDAELDTVERRLRSNPDLAAHEVARLMACGRALAADPPKVRSAFKRVGEVPAGQRAFLAASAVEAVLADGTVQPDEVKFLEALHAALGLPAAALYASLHRGAEDVGPVTVSSGGAENIVPIPPERSGSSVPIDAARLERIRGETNRVSALLATIFVEDEPEVLQPATRVPEAGAFKGLDGPHSQLLLALLAGPLRREDFDAAAAALRLMPDGAIETINEWGFDHFGEPVLDDDDEVRVSPDVIEQLEPVGASA
ncbi:TerB N-terminal domain-containing protein [Glacieibacterium megasporae]|uniref:tellurite resistance TerB family protein n=1 Tax=Glacieibacterium megasporae TaxID=2835787 RepID=UPI001C1E6B95|nr:TerB N-terminal domain-containing protein [Polymorphobacter megasporae]UAJ12658.1 TerB N-terminal domain-containing protein [Polymorphobacter megasporae]